jgi:hypothetical protein
MAEWIHEHGGKAKDWIKENKDKAADWFEDLFKIKSKNQGLVFLADSQPIEDPLLNIEAILHHIDVINDSFKSADDWKAFFEGILSGLSNNPSGDNKCTGDLEPIKGEIVQFLQDIQADIKARDFKKLISDCMSLWKLITATDNDCHFKELAADIAALGTDAGLMKLAWRLVSNGPQIIQDGKDTYADITSGQFNPAGKALGDSVKLALDFTVE